MLLLQKMDHRHTYRRHGDSVFVASSDFSTFDCSKQSVLGPTLAYITFLGIGISSFYFVFILISFSLSSPAFHSRLVILCFGIPLPLCWLCRSLKGESALHSSLPHHSLTQLPIGWPRLYHRALVVRPRCTHSSCRLDLPRLSFWERP